MTLEFCNGASIWAPVVSGYTRSRGLRKYKKDHRSQSQTNIVAVHIADKEC